MATSYGRRNLRGKVVENTPKGSVQMTPDEERLAEYLGAATLQTLLDTESLVGQSGNHKNNLPPRLWFMYYQL